MIKEMYRANPRDYDDYSRSESREREKRDSINNRQPSKNAIYKGFKLHIANLPLGVSEEFVKLQFERFGKVEDVRIMRKDSNGQPLKGSLYGFVTMFTKEDAAYALEEINKEKMLAWNVSYSKEGKKNHNDASRSPQRMGRAKARQNRELNEEKSNAKLHENPVMIQAPKRKESTDIFFARSYTGVTNEETCSNPDDYISYSAGHNADDALLLTFLAENSKESHQSAHETDLAKTAAETPSEKLSSTTSTSEKTMLKGNPIRVRELWFGNLSQNLDEHELKYHVEMFGEIENIEYYTKPNTSFAFVKFKEITQASRASESTQNLKNILNSPNLKIAFSDHQRRKNVVGDSLDYERVNLEI
jgi:RNA recognition motif-containing protein